MIPPVAVPLWTLIVTSAVTILGVMLAIMMAALFQIQALDRLTEGLRAEIRAETTALRAEMK